MDCGWDGFVVLLTCFCFISDVGSKCLCDSKSKFMYCICGRGWCCVTIAKELSVFCILPHVIGCPEDS